MEIEIIVLCFWCYCSCCCFSFHRFDTNKSTKGASKLRRDLINTEIANLRDLLPLPQSTRQRLSQLQLMALVCVYVRKANYFQQGNVSYLLYTRYHSTQYVCKSLNETLFLQQFSIIFHSIRYQYISSLFFYPIEKNMNTNKYFSFHCSKPFLPKKNVIRNATL